MVATLPGAPRIDLHRMSDDEVLNLPAGAVPRRSSARARRANGARNGSTMRARRGRGNCGSSTESSLRWKPSWKAFDRAHTRRDEFRDELTVEISVERRSIGSPKLGIRETRHSSFVASLDHRVTQARLHACLIQGNAAMCRAV
jgi:hypothetical protein